MDSCSVHEACQEVVRVTGLLFDGSPMLMVDIAEARPGARAYGSECTSHPVAGFQMKDPVTGDWYQVQTYRINNPSTLEALEEFAAQLAQEEAAEQPAAEEAIQDALAAD